MDVGDVDEKAEKLLIPVDLSQYPSNDEIAATLLKKVPKGVHNVLVDFISRLYAVYVDCQFTCVHEDTRSSYRKFANRTKISRDQPSRCHPKR